MVTSHIRYVLDPSKIKEFEHFGRLWIPITDRMEGTHHGYLLLSEGRATTRWQRSPSRRRSSTRSSARRTAIDPGAEVQLHRTISRYNII